MLSRFPVTFRSPAFASWASCPARELVPACARLTSLALLHRPDPDEVSVFHTRKVRLGLAVLSTPGAVVSSRSRSILDRRLPPLNGRPLPPCAASRHRAFA
jgi:hypothetical protein